MSRRYSFRGINGSMETMRHAGGYLGPSHKTDRVFTHSSRLHSTGPSMYPPNQQLSGGRRGVGPPSQYGRRQMDDFGYYGGGGMGGSGQYYGGGGPVGQRYGNTSAANAGGGGAYQQQQQVMRQPQQRYRRMPQQRRRVFSQGNEYRNGQPMRPPAPRRYICDVCHVEFETAQARSRHARRAHTRIRRSTEGNSGDQANKTQSAGSQTNQPQSQNMSSSLPTNPGSNVAGRRGGGGGRPTQQQDRKRRFVCQHCRAVFNSAKSITVHMKEHHPTGEDSAQPVNPAATTSATGEVTYITSDVNLHNCAYCPFAFMSAGELARHRARCRGSQQFSIDLKLIHPGNEGFLVSCPLCRTMVNLAHGLKRHVDQVHPFAKINVAYECALCKKAFEVPEPSAPESASQEQPSGEEQPAGEEAAGEKEQEDKRLDDPVHRTLEAIKAHVTNDHTDEEVAELKKRRAAVFAEQSLKAYERFQRRPGQGPGNRRRMFSQRNRRSTNTTTTQPQQPPTTDVNTVMGDMLTSLQSLDIGAQSPEGAAAPPNAAAPSTSNPAAAPAASQ